MEARKLGSLLLAIFIAMSIAGASATVCNTMSNGAEWKDARLKINTLSYFSFRVYNSSADNRICDTSDFAIDVELEDSTQKLDDIFDWEIDTQNFTLLNGESKKILLTMKPKQNGQFTVKITTKIMPKNSGGTQLIYSTSAKINASVSETGDESYNEVPFWKIRKDCPNGLVVKEGEECPKLCKDGTKILESKGEKCKEDQIGFFAGKSELLLWGGVGGAIATVAVLGLVAFRRKHEATAGSYNAEQEKYY